MTQINQEKALELYRKIHRICANYTISTKHKLSDLRIIFEEMIDSMIKEPRGKGVTLDKKLDAILDPDFYPANVIHEAHELRKELNKHHHPDAPERNADFVLEMSRMLMGFVFLLSDEYPPIDLLSLVQIAFFDETDIETLAKLCDEELSSEQASAASSTNQITIVKAGAGTGKTRMLKYRYLFLQMNPEQRPGGNIFIITYTNKAAIELKARIYKDLLKFNIKEKPFIGTIHSFAYQFILQYHEEVQLEEQFTVLDETEDVELLARMIKTDEKKVVGAFRRRCNIGEMADAGNEILSDVDKARLKDYETFKERHLLLNFDDILRRFARYLEEDKQFYNKVVDNVSCLLVDEFQDVSFSQFRIFEKLLTAKRMNFTCVGDPLQSIYLFRGAYPRIFEHMSNISDSAVFELSQNYRTTGPIAEFANRLAWKFSNPGAINSTKDGQLPMIMKAETVEDEAIAIVNKIISLRSNLQEKPSLGSIAILFRYIKQSENVCDLLNTHAIPYAVVGGQVELKDEIRNILAFVKIASNPKNAIAWERVKRMTDGDLSIPPERSSKLKAGRYLVSQLEELDLNPHCRRVIALMDGLKKAGSFTYSLNELVDWYSSIMVIPESSMPSVQNMLTIASRSKDVKAFLKEVFLNAYDMGLYGTPKRPEGDFLTISTVHSAKGLEWDIVFVANVVDDVYPSFISKQNIIVAESNPNHHSAAELNYIKEEMREDLSVLYVAITRARRQLYISYHTQYFRHMKSLSRFVDKVDPKLYQ